MNINEYLKKIESKLATGLSTEHTHRPLLEEYIKTHLSDAFEVINESRQHACGRPDLTIVKGDIQIGYIEAKDIICDLRKEEKSEQLKRYKTGLDNLILTNHLDFHFYIGGEEVGVVKIASLEADGKTLKYHNKNFDELDNRIKNFLIFKGQEIVSAEKLASLMAKKAQMMRYVFSKTLTQSQNNEENSDLLNQYKAFQKILIHDLTREQFCDFYAQTIAHGLFTARMHDKTPDDFSRFEARDLIPKSSPFLRKLFSTIADVELDDRIIWIVDSLCELFRLVKKENILKDFTFKEGGQDPLIHFYETFLSEYDPTLRKSRGVWYTPLPVVNFIVRAIDDCLKKYFHLPDGIATVDKITIQTKTPDVKLKKGTRIIERDVHRVQLLDVATGTGTFIAEVIQHIYKNKFAHQKASWSNYVDEHLLPRIHGFEILMASYAMCHLKMDLLLEELGYKPKDPKKPKRLSVYLSNALEEAHPDSDTLFAQWLSHEANEASHIKRDMPIMIAFGNPPYNVESKNKGKWIMELMGDYKKEPASDEKLKERNSKSINDDYVKFMRFGQYFIDKNGQGILAYINAHGFLDNPTFRGMRWRLLSSYDEIYIIDLHGNAKKKEKAPDGGKDENVFDIQQGVSINIFIKTGKKKKNQLGEIFHHDLYGLREDKYKFLQENSLSSILFKRLPNKAPMYFMVQKDFALEKPYKKGFGVDELFKVKNVGIVTARDGFTIHKKKEDLIKTVKDFLDLEDDEAARVKFNLGKDVRDWRVNFARSDLKTINFDDIKPIKISYRPFDARYTYYTGKSRGFHCLPRNNVMRHFFKGDNLGFVFKIGNPEENSCSIHVSRLIIDYRSWSRPGMQGGDYISPLYLYPDHKDLLSGDKRTPNVNMEIIQKIGKAIKRDFIADHEDEKAQDKNIFTPLDVLDYIYAVLHSPTYRKKYKEFLKIDFPKIPYPKNVDEFFALAEKGKELRLYHLMEHSNSHQLMTCYNVTGDNFVVKLEYKEGAVFINEKQHFGNVPKSAWEFYIGGYQPAKKWLKDRKGRALNFDDLQHYQKIIVALTNTHRLMQEIDALEKENETSAL